MRDHGVIANWIGDVSMQTTAPSCVQAAPAALAGSDIDRFREDGFLAFNGILQPDEIAAARREISRLVAELAASPEVTCEGRNMSRPGERFGIQFEPGCDPATLSGEGLELALRKLMYYCEASPFFDDMARRHARLQGFIEALLGEPAVLFQDMALIKPPHIGTIKPWHQDNAYFAVAPLDKVIGLWIALDDATVENGCMHVIPGGHREGAFRHHHDRDCEIAPGRFDDSRQVPIELKAGGALFFYGMLPHQTPPNTSAHRRRALQFHYHGVSCQVLDEATYNTVFVEPDGTPASCRAAS